MKTKWIFSGALIPLASVAFAGGVTIGNGGDTTLPERLSSAKLEAHIYSTKKILADIFNALDLNTASPEGAQKAPHYYLKLFSMEGKLVDVTKTAVIEINNEDACFNAVGEPKDGSATIIPVPKICISTYRLRDKVNSHDAYIKVGGLLAHEFSHLAGTNEAEARDFQIRIERILNDVSISQWQNFDFLNQGRIDFLRFLYGFSIPSEVAESQWTTACASLKSADEQFQNLLPKFGKFSKYHSKNYGELAANYLRHKLVEISVCKKAGEDADAMDLAAMELLFGGQPSISFDEADRDALTLLGIIHELPRPHFVISKISNEQDLNKLINQLATAF